MTRLLNISLILFLASYSFGQIKGKALKLEGIWEYKESAGFEEWTMVDDDLVGKAYRVGKMGDTSVVEQMHIRMADKNLIFTSTTYNYMVDSLRSDKHVFVGGKRKMNFINVDRQIPYSIKYSFGFLNRNKLKINIYFNKGEKSKTIVLNRRKKG